MAVLDLIRCPICQARDSLARQTTQLESRIHVTYECHACGTLLAWLGDEMWLEADRWSFQKVGRPERADLLYRSMTVAELRRLSGETPPAPSVLPEKPAPQPRRPVWVDITPAQQKAQREEPAAAETVVPEPVEAPPVAEPEPEPEPVAASAAAPEPVEAPPALEPQPELVPVAEPEPEPELAAVEAAAPEPVEAPPIVGPERAAPMPQAEPVEAPPVMEPAAVEAAAPARAEPVEAEPVEAQPVVEPEPEPVPEPAAAEPELVPLVEPVPVREPQPVREDVPVGAKPEPWIVELPGAEEGKRGRRAARLRSEQRRSERRRREASPGLSQRSRGRGSPFLVISVGLVLLCLICSAAAMIIYSMVGNWPPEASVPTTAPRAEATATETPAPTETPIPTEAPAPTETPAQTEAVDDVAFQGITGYLSSTGSYYLVGEVLNRTSDTLRFVEVLATFYDGSRQVMGTSSTFTELSFVRPGGTAPFKVTAPDLSQLGRYELAVDYETTSQPPILLEIVNHGGTPDSGGWYRIMGEVRNPHDFTVKFPEIVATFYNGAHEVVRVEVAFAQADPLAPGQT